MVKYSPRFTFTKLANFLLKKYYIIYDTLLTIVSCVLPTFPRPRMQYLRTTWLPSTKRPIMFATIISTSSSSPPHWQLISWKKWRSGVSTIRTVSFCVSWHASLYIQWATLLTRIWWRNSDSLCTQLYGSCDLAKIV